jgi:hypothetical protein
MGGCPGHGNSRHVMTTEISLELFVVLDKAFLGRGVFGVFSTIEKAEAFAEVLFEETHQLCSTTRCTVMGLEEYGETVYAAHLYNDLYDTYVVDGIYAKAAFAFDAVGDKGLIIRFKVDSPDEREIVRDF